jgi:phosphatidylserine/phosphatidylglycerophosphate/cardiolipin synthase-like enzyme
MAGRLLGVSASAAQSGAGARYSVHFSPKGGCEAAVVAVVAAAKRSVLVQAYGFTSGPIAAALIAAHKRGVTVRIVLDSEGKTARSNKGSVCVAAGLDVAWDAKHLIAHNKVMVIDSQVVVTGSFNFTASAETGNAENLLVVNDSDLAAAYAANWESHRGHSAP